VATLDPTQPDGIQLDLTQSGLAHSTSSQAATWLVRVPVAERVDRLADLNAALIQDGRTSRSRRVLLAAARLAATFCIGVTATLAWQPYGDAARMMIANSSPQLGWLAPQAASGLASPAFAPQARSTASDLDAVRERIDRIATSQEQMTRTVAQLTASQEQIAKEIAKVREVEQYLLYKTSYKAADTAPPRPVTAPVVHVHKPTRRLAQSAAR